MTVPVAERGYVAGRSPWWGSIDDGEDTPELRWPASVEVQDRMRRQDAQVMSVLRAVTLPVRRTNWWVDGTGCRDQVTQLVADDLGLAIANTTPRPPVRTRDRFSWPDHLRLALLMLPFGHSFFEQVYRIDQQGRARLRKLGWRPPRTITQVDVAADGGLVAIHQGAPLLFGRASEPVIPVDRLVAYVNDREGGNWLGQSLLRPAYKFWLLKDRALRTQSIALDRNGLGVPIYTSSEQPESVRGEERAKRERAERDAGQALVENYRGGENAGASIPHGATLTLRGVDGKLPDADPAIRYYDEQIARAVLAHFLNLGTETGSWALGSTFADFFTLSLQTVANHIADVATQHIVEDLVDLNYGPEEPAPRIVFDEIGSRHPATAEAMRILVDAGIVTADDVLEHHTRTAYGLPPADPNTARRPQVPAGQDGQAA